MSLRFTVLASGSAGNATLVEADRFGVLIDAGLGPRQLSARLTAAGLSWASVHAVLLTHTHSDHWKDRTLAHLQRRGVPFYCHPDHHGTLLTYSPAFVGLRAAGLVRPFTPHEPFEPAPGLRCRALPVRHDGGATFGFRLEGAPDLFGRAAAVAYAADLGCWDEGLVESLADVDLLAVEFNHDVALEYASGRMPRLIARVLGDEGHLSNAQAAELVRAVLARSPEGRLRHLVQLHLSRDCNRPGLARAAAQAALAARPEVTVHTAEQDAPGAPVHLSAGRPAARRPRRPRERRGAAAPFSQPWLPGLDGGPSGAAG
jgi:phosphoribosyl 1,2-cyclic phosphodiesterase